MSNRTLLRIATPEVIITLLVATFVALFAARHAGAGPGPQPPDGSGGVSATPLAWAPCDSGAEGWECATLTVPLNYAHPEGETIDLALTRLPASDPVRRIGPLLINFGGPGGAAVENLHMGGTVMFNENLRAHFDLVGFDPRGVGLSAPLDCKLDLETYYAVDVTPDNEVERLAQRDAARMFADACAANGGALLPLIGTDNVVRDVEQLRIALGEEQISYWGPSYGTSIAVQYIREYPQHVRAFSIEDVLTTDLDGSTLARDAAVGFERAFDAFLDYCAADATCAFHSEGNPGAAFDAMLARLESEPLRSSGDPRPITEGDVLEIAYGGASRMASWPELAQLLAFVAAGDAETLRPLFDQMRGRNADGSYAPANSMYAHLAVHCIDNSFPRSQSEFDALMAEVVQLAPRTGAYYMNLGMPCVYWSAPYRPQPAAPTGEGAPALLIVNGTLDPQTPFVWAERLAGQLPSSVLLTREGSGHVSYFHSACVAAVVDAYLIDLTLPAPGTVCDSAGGPSSLQK